LTDSVTKKFKETKKPSKNPYSVSLPRRLRPSLPPQELYFAHEIRANPFFARMLSNQMTEKLNREPHMAGGLFHARACLRTKILRGATTHCAPQIVENVTLIRTLVCGYCGSASIRRFKSSIVL
jgi:hypothetical protein